MKPIREFLFDRPLKLCNIASEFTAEILNNFRQSLIVKGFSQDQAYNIIIKLISLGKIS
jgi:hypothetical protein